MNIKKAVLIIAQSVLGLAILVFLIHSAGISKVSNIIPTLNMLYVLLAAFAFSAASVAVALTLFILLNSTSSSSSLPNTIAASFGGQLISDITPARSGYFLTPFILNKIDGTEIESSMAAVTITGATNFFLKAFLSILAIGYFMGRAYTVITTINQLLIGVLLLITGGLGSFFLIWSNKVESIAKKLVQVPIIGKIGNKLVEILDNFQREGQKAKKAIIPTALLIFLSVILNAAALQLIAMSLNMTKPCILDFILMVPLVSAFMYVPLTIAGLGVQESAYVFLLTGLGVPLETAVVFALVARALFTGTDFIGLPFLLKAGSKYL